MNVDGRLKGFVNKIGKKEMVLLLSEGYKSFLGIGESDVGFLFFLYLDLICFIFFIRLCKRILLYLNLGIELVKYL